MTRPSLPLHDQSRWWPMNLAVALALPVLAVARWQRGDRTLAALIAIVAVLNLLVAIHRLRRRRAITAAALSAPNPKTNP